MRSKKGFSTLEVLLVVTILLLVASFGFPAVMREISRAKDTAAVTTLHNVESVYRMSRSVLLLRDSEASAALLLLRESVHIPRRAAEASNGYVEFITKQIDYAFASHPPVYEILETRVNNEQKTRFYYWPEPKKTPELCYMLENGSVTRGNVPQPETEPVVQESSSAA